MSMLDFGGVGSKCWRIFKSRHFFTCCKTFQIYHLANRISSSRLLQGLAVFEYYVIHCHTEKAHVSLMWCPSLCDSVQNRSAKLFGFCVCSFLLKRWAHMSSFSSRYCSHHLRIWSLRQSLKLNWVDSWIDFGPCQNTWVNQQKSWEYRAPFIKMTRCWEVPTPCDSQIGSSPRGKNEKILETTASCDPSFLGNLATP